MIGIQVNVWVPFPTFSRPVGPGLWKLETAVHMPNFAPRDYVPSPRIRKPDSELRLHLSAELEAGNMADWLI